jgi:exonuclease SbcC
MIPLKLQLKNFLSYGPQTQTIDFAPHHLICLSGKNGHGKSALLDALTWALWGQARKVLGTVKADEGLLRLGQTGMMVLCEFICHGHTYRVRREFSFINNKSHASLDFGIIDPISQICKPLTDKTIRTTQERIIATLGLDYDGFINSVFLRQGQANEFSRKSPKDRKEILATMLGLDRYEQLRKRAFEKLRALQADRDIRLALKEHNQQELSQQTAIEQQREELAQQNTVLHAREDQHNQELLALEQQQQLFDKKIETYNVLSFSYEHLVRTLTNEQERFVTLFKTWRSVHRYRLGGEQLMQQDIATLEEKFLGMQAQAAEYLRLQASYHALQEEIRLQEQRLRTDYEQQLHKLDKTLVMQEHTMCAKKEQLSEKETHQQKRIVESGATINAAHKLAQTITNYAQQEASLTLLEKSFERRKHYYQKFTAQKNVLTKELTLVGQQQRTIAHTETKPHCPLCEQPLSDQHHLTLQQRFTQEEKLKLHQMNRLERLLNELKTVLSQQHSNLQILRTAHADRRLIVHQHQELMTTIAHQQRTIQDESMVIEKLRAVLVEQEGVLIYLQNQVQQAKSNYPQLLAQDTRYQEVLTRLQYTEKQLSTLAYDRAAHELVIHQREDFLRHQTSVHAAVKNQALQDQRREEIATLVRALKQRKQEQKNLKLQLQEYAPIQTEKMILIEQKQSLGQKFKELQKQKEQLVHNQGIIEQQYRALQKRAQEIKEQQEQLTLIDTNIDDYQTIIQALSKDGIQALLIEEAIPEIEQEANTLLAKLTDNQAHLSIESLRDLKSGGTKETLDIKISDPLGIRPYEMFSGGEAFRIDFSLRIAISKLLARRAGTSLQTLIIDEGFGSQDGLTHIMDALHRIQDDFAKIIIVSHLPTMKDQFPVHFMVAKGPHGSSIRVIENG